MLQYEQAMLQKREAEAKIYELREKVLGVVRASGTTERNGARVRYRGQHGSFLILKTAKYEYSRAVELAQIDLDLLKERERRTNTAKKVESEIFVFKQPAREY